MKKHDDRNGESEEERSEGQGTAQEVRIHSSSGHVLRDSAAIWTLRSNIPPFFSPLLPVGSQESVLKVPKLGQFHALLRVRPKRCDSCAQSALGRRAVSRRHFCDAESGCQASWRGVDLWGAPRNFWGRLGKFQGSLGNFRGTSGSLLRSH